MPAGVAVPLGIALVSRIVLLDTGSTVRGVAGFVFTLLAEPFLLVLGAPLTTGTDLMLLGTVLSAALWAAIGALATRRATRNPAAVWSDFWREFAWLGAGVWAGTLVALVLTNLILGRAFL